jgi:hypothetical protein
VQLIANKLWKGAVAGLLNFKRIGDSGRYQARPRDRGQIDELNSCGEFLCHGRGQGNRESGLSGTAGASQAQ